MSADKRALDDLDALFRAVPAQKASASRPSKRPRSGRTTAIGTESAVESRIAAAGTGAPEPQQERIMYTRLPAALLPRGFRGAPSTPRGSGGSGSSTSSGSRAATAVGIAAVNRLTEFMRGMLCARGDRAAAAAMESRLERKVMHLENVGSGQTEAQSAGARAGRAAGSVTRQGLSGKTCKKKGLNALKARGTGRVSFRDMLGLHDLWKEYAGRLISDCGGTSGSGTSLKLLQQRILAADLQGCYLKVSQSSVSSLVNLAGIVLRETSDTFQIVTPDDKTKTIPKHSCAVRLAFGGQVVDLNTRTLTGRRGRGAGGGRQRGGQDRGSGGASATADDTPDVFPLPTAAL
eukprot:g5069.t1